MMPTRLQDRALIAKIIGVPIPPAPTIPRIDAERTANSKRYKVNDKNSGINCGKVANPKTAQRFPPALTTDSEGP